MSSSWKGITGQALVIRNYLREQPLELARLCAFAGHSHGYLRLVGHQLRLRGQLSDENVVDLNHAANEPFIQKGPLPDPPERIPRVAAAAGIEAKTVALRAVAEFSPGAMPEVRKARSLSELRALLERYIDNGGNRGDIVGAIRALIDIGEVDDRIGPSDPQTPRDEAKRLLDCMLCCTEWAVEKAYRQWKTQRRDMADHFDPGDPNENPETTGDDPLERTGAADDDPAPEADGAEPSDPQLPKAGWDEEHRPLADPQGPEAPLSGSS